MRLLRAALVALFVVGSEVLAVPVTSCCEDRDHEQDRIDPLKSEDSFSDGVNRTKRKFKPEEMAAANLILNSLEERRKREEQLAVGIENSTKAPPRKKARQASQDDELDEENEVAADDENAPFGAGGKVTLQIPGKLFGNATNLFLGIAKLFGDFITNTAIRSARFLQIFQPLFGRNLYIQIPSTTTESNEV